MTFNALDALDHVRESVGDDLPTNWLPCVCALPLIGTTVSRGPLALGLFAKCEQFLDLEDQAAVIDAITRSTGDTLLACLQVSGAYEIDLGAALLDAVARQLKPQPGEFKA